MNYREAVEALCTGVEYHWAGDSASGGRYEDIMDWDRNHTGTPKPTEQQLIDHYAVLLVERAAAAEAALLDMQARLAALEDAMIALLAGE